MSGRQQMWLWLAALVALTAVLMVWIVVGYTHPLP